MKIIAWEYSCLLSLPAARGIHANALGSQMQQEAAVFTDYESQRWNIFTITYPLLGGYGGQTALYSQTLLCRQSLNIETSL